MKLAGFLLMPAGFFIAVSAVALLHTLPAQTAFCLAGVSIQIVGFVFVAREHLHDAEKKKRGHSGLPTALPPNEFSRHVPSFSPPSRPSSSAKEQN